MRNAPLFLVIIAAGAILMPDNNNGFWDLNASEWVALFAVIASAFWIGWQTYRSARKRHHTNMLFVLSIRSLRSVLRSITLTEKVLIPGDNDVHVAIDARFARMPR